MIGGKGRDGREVEVRVAGRLGGGGRCEGGWGGGGVGSEAVVGRRKEMSVRKERGGCGEGERGERGKGDKD